MIYSTILGWWTWGTDVKQDSVQTLRRLTQMSGMSAAQLLADLRVTTWELRRDRQSLVVLAWTAFNLLQQHRVSKPASKPSSARPSVKPRAKTGSRTRTARRP